ncbi:MAG: hypothetical protein HXY25_02365 [Alphaproteobacteria bacterium]|nr:hypothetical protein [Alphaproteobacteria bacterium]
MQQSAGKAPLWRRLARSTGLHKLAPTRTVHLPPAPPDRPLEALDAHSRTFPSMGGMELGPYFRMLARQVPAGTAIVEVGVWLGAGTAQLAYALAERRAAGHPVPPIYCYDRWMARPSHVPLAARQGWQVTPLHETLPLVRDALRPFGTEIHFRAGELRQARWNDGPIGIYIDDASKKQSDFRKVMRTFGPSFVPGQTVLVLMDYHYAGIGETEWQRRFISALPGHFEALDVPELAGSNTAAFRYLKPVDFEAAIAAGTL